MTTIFKTFEKGLQIAWNQYLGFAQGLNQGRSTVTEI